MDRVNAAWIKLDKYYRYTDKTNAYVAATILNPLYKWHFFEQRWMEPTLAAALADHRVQFQELWRLNYAGDPSPQLNIPQEPHDDVDDFEAFLYRQVMQRPVLDDLQLYLQDPHLIIQDRKEFRTFRALSWWTEATQQSHYPLLLKMAFDLLTVPAMSA